MGSCVLWSFAWLAVSTTKMNPSVDSRPLLFDTYIHRSSWLPWRPDAVSREKNQTYAAFRPATRAVAHECNLIR
ncbi:hypothetical protein GGS21DRAFT_536053 [Xylaria nigripes]|nr:hypothetical protein GGS21DRAFT_536053 [Xylaria nigripes]